MKTARAYYEAKLEYYTDASDLQHVLQNENNWVVVDVRRSEHFNLGHIPSAINLYHADMNTESTQHWDKSKTYIAYCDGIGCNGSTKGARNLSALGFKVKELIGGFDWWQRDGYAFETDSAVGEPGIRCGC